MLVAGSRESTVVTVFEAAARLACRRSLFSFSIFVSNNRRHARVMRAG